MSGQSRNYYFTMGLSQNCSPEDVKQAYRKLALKFHPDRNPGNAIAENRFKMLLEAYQVLSDPRQRAEYDLVYSRKYSYSSGFKREESRPSAEREAPRQEQKSDSRTATREGEEEIRLRVHDIFTGLDESLKKHSVEPSPIKGADLRYHLTVDFKTALFGGRHEIHFQSRAVCTVCSGSGAQENSRLTPCPRCFGRGLMGEGGQSEMCGECLGHGVLALDECRVCGGEGSVKTRRRLTVTTPPACESGAKLRISGEGEPGLNLGPQGDLLIVVTVKEHPLFFRQGYDLVCELPLSLGRAALGGTVEAPTVDGVEKLKIKPGVQHGEVLSIKGKGVPRKEDGTDRGDQKYIVTVEIPRKLSPRQKALFQELDELSEPDSLVMRFRRKMQEFFG